MNPNELAFWYWLSNVRGIGPVIYKRLLDKFGSPAEVFQSTVDEIIGRTGIRKSLAASIELSKRDFNQYISFAEKQVEVVRNLNGDILTGTDSRYCDIYERHGGDEALPAIIHVVGDINCLSRRKFAIVGTRRPSEFGRRRAYDLALNMAKDGIAIVSGLAIGIDSESHRGAMNSGGKTIAVLGCGADISYPPSNSVLYEDILRRGLIVSEFPFGVRPTSENLRRRNRTIVSMSEGVVIAECPIKSGAMIAARFAAQQKKPIFSFTYGRATDNSGGEWLISKSLAKGLKDTTSDNVINASMNYQLPDNASIDKIFLELWPKKKKPKADRKISRVGKKSKKRTDGKQAQVTTPRTSENQQELLLNLRPQLQPLTDGQKVFTLVVGDKVMHPEFGQGEIVTIVRTGNDYQITIRFPHNRIRTFLWQYTNLTRI